MIFSLIPLPPTLYRNGRRPKVTLPYKEVVGYGHGSNSLGLEFGPNWIDNYYRIWIDPQFEDVVSFVWQQRPLMSTGIIFNISHRYNVTELVMSA